MGVTAEYTNGLGREPETVLKSRPVIFCFGVPIPDEETHSNRSL